MNSLAFDHSLFPQLPIGRYYSAPIYLEPMAGSGERLTVAGVVVGDDGFLVDRLISSDTAKAMYGNQGKAFLGLADLLIANLRDYLQAENSRLEDWLPCLSGVSLGAITPAYADNLRHALAQVAQLHASLCRLPALMALEEDEQEHGGNDNALKAWVKQVQAQTVANHPDLQSFFNIKQTLAHGDSIILHFARLPMAANIGLITPVNLNQHVNDAKIKLWNLDHLPNQYTEKRLVLGMPREDAPEMADPRVRDKVRDKINALGEQAQKSRIHLVTAYSALEAANRMAA